MHDKAPCHRSKMTKEWLEDHEVLELPWPGNSPDLNPAENLWYFTKRRVAAKSPKSLLDLGEAVEDAWDNEIPTDYCLQPMISMPNRLREVIKMNGFIANSKAFQHFFSNFKFNFISTKCVSARKNFILKKIARDAAVYNFSSTNVLGFISRQSLETTASGETTTWTDSEPS